MTKPPDIATWLIVLVSLTALGISFAALAMSLVALIGEHHG